MYCCSIAKTVRQHMELVIESSITCSQIENKICYLSHIYNNNNNNIIIIFWLKHQYLKHKYQSMVQQIIANILSETVYTGITNLYIITKNQQNTKQYIINVNSVFLKSIVFSFFLKVTTL